MKKVLTLVVFAIIIFGFTAINCSAENYQWASSYRTITQIYPDTDFQFYLSGDTIDTNSSCANRFVVWYSGSNYDVQVASLLIAFQNGYPVLVKYDDDDTGCGTHVDMVKVQAD